MHTTITLPALGFKAQAKLIPKDPEEKEAPVVERLLCHQLLSKVSCQEHLGFWLDHSLIYEEHVEHVLPAVGTRFFVNPSIA